MIAVLILALVLGATFRTVSQLARGAKSAAETRAAVLVARSTLALAGPVIPLEPGITRGIEGRHAWEVSIERAAGQGSAGPIMRVTASVGTVERPRNVSLSTLKLPGLP